MIANRIFRWAAVAAILAAVAPAPASAQIGRFIKNKVKQRIAQAVVETVLPSDTATPGGAQRAALGLPLQGDAGAVPRSGPVFNESVLEITATVLQNLERGLVAEVAERKISAPQLAKILDSRDYSPCVNKLGASAAGRKLLEVMNNGPYEGERQRAREALEKLQLATCGPYPELGFKWRQEFAERQAQAIRQASGLTPRQYEILKERVIPFCTLGVSTAGHSVPHVAQGGAFLVYSVQEIMALGPWCPLLSQSFKALP